MFSNLNAGFARQQITPPIGTVMSGFIGRDRQMGCEEIHDDLFVRVLWLEQEGTKFLIIGFDLLFFTRATIDRIKGILAFRYRILPENILINTSHTHCGPKVDDWKYYPQSDLLYLDHLIKVTIHCVALARQNAKPAEMFAAETHSRLPVSRRLPQNGKIEFKPNLYAPVCSTLPVVLLRDKYQKPICLLFSVSCHPSTVHGFSISADYPGAAMEIIDRYLGANCSLFLQGTGGDSKACVIAENDNWLEGDWNDVLAAGQIVADEVIDCIESFLMPIEPELGAELREMSWPLQNLPQKEYLCDIINNGESERSRLLWAGEILEKIDRGFDLPKTVPVFLHGFRLAADVRLIGLEGEAVAELGNIIVANSKNGITFPLGYCNGAQLYLITSKMVNEGGYEAESYYEYRFPAPLATGMETILSLHLDYLNSNGIF